MTPQIRSFLTQSNIYLDPTYLSTFDNVKVGALILSHPQFTRRDSAIRDLNLRISKNEEDKTLIQLSPRIFWNESGSRISTKVLAVECSKEHVQLVKHRFFSKFLNIPEPLTYSNTRLFKFMPFTATSGITDKVIRLGIYLQNEFLTQTTAVTMINLNRLDWKIPESDTTFT